MPSTRRSFLAACAAGLGSIAGCVSVDEPVADGSWPRRTVDNARTGHATTEGPTRNLHTVWRRDHPRGGPVTSPVVADGTLYFAYSDMAEYGETARAWVEAYDAVTGESEWRTELLRTEEFSRHNYLDSLVVDGDRLFVQTEPGLTMLTTDGEVQWTFDNLFDDSQPPDVLAPVTTDETVVTATYGTGDGRGEVVYGIDPETGSERWRTTFPDEWWMRQLVGTDGVVYVPLGGPIVALDVETGVKRWSLGVPYSGGLTVAGNLLLFTAPEAGGEKSLVAVDRRDRSVRWRERIGPQFSTSDPSVSDGRVYSITGLGLTAGALETGERVWRFGSGRDDEGETRPDEPMFARESTPVVSGGAVYAPGFLQRDTVYGHLFVVDAATGEELGRVEMDRNERARTATPAVTSDLVFLGSNYGSLFAFGECSAGVGGHCLIE